MKASYTVEASFIVSFCIIIIGIGVCISYDVFRDAFEYVQRKDNTFDAVNTFYIKELAKKIIK